MSCSIGIIYSGCYVIAGVGDGGVGWLLGAVAVGDGGVGEEFPSVVGLVCFTGHFVFGWLV